MWRKLARLLSVLAVSGLIPAAAWAEFVPRALYMTFVPIEGCLHNPIPEIVVEFDPLTAQSRIVGEVPLDECGNSNGLAFTPDGAGLRLATWGTSTIHEFDVQGNRSVVLDNSDGILGPYGTNSIAYGPDGSFYAVNWDTQLLRFPPSGGPAEVYGDAASGAAGVGAITITPDNRLYFAKEFTGEVRVFTGPHQSEVFDVFPGLETTLSITSDDEGNIFVMTWIGIYRYDAGDPTSRRLLLEFSAETGAAALAISPDGETLYAVRGGFIYAVDPWTGESDLAGTTGGFGDRYGPRGIAVYVPEPGAAIMILILAGLAARRR